METQLWWGKTKLINFGGVYSEKHSFPVWPLRWQCNAGENKDILRKHKGLLLDITFQTASNIDGCKIHTHTHICIYFFVGNYQPSLCKMSPGQLQLHQQWLIIVLLKHIHQHLLMYTALFTCMWHLREPWPVFPSLWFYFILTWNALSPKKSGIPYIATLVSYSLLTQWQIERFVIMEFRAINPLQTLDCITSFSRA